MSATSSSIASQRAAASLPIHPVAAMFTGGLLALSMMGGAQKAHEYHLSPAAGALVGAAGFAAGMYINLRMFGTSLFKGFILGGFWDDLVLGPLALMTFKRQWLYESRGFRQRHYRATIAPWSYSEEPTERATEAMRRGMSSIRGYQSFFGNEAAVMAARYAR
jgi:hypothetical protein